MGSLTRCSNNTTVIIIIIILMIIITVTHGQKFNGEAFSSPPQKRLAVLPPPFEVFPQISKTEEKNNNKKKKKFQKTNPEEKKINHNQRERVHLPKLNFANERSFLSLAPPLQPSLVRGVSPVRPSKHHASFQFPRGPSYFASPPLIFPSHCCYLFHFLSCTVPTFQEIFLFICPAVLCGFIYFLSSSPLPSPVSSIILFLHLSASWAIFHSRSIDTPFVPV
ncbi:hypothetical protein BP00DRAFT_255895 [Aspergillus indologenus CBS 114.80]|uniref:Transmembrane protein n=1 Tax=Aspergillus indologenus CBS 114.80 TaxID=1450541 RepID=A0A2V5HXR6_9EURO|nr:hypothetical protein BP00DRAFT_255895 [Aspergillus indologenus CBS 114.80]